MSKIATIKDRDGDVWTGRVVEKPASAEDIAIGLFTGGLAVLAPDINTTVEVNGETHSGTKVK